MKEKPELGKRIQEARKAAGLSQTELAEKLDKTLRTIQKYESGEIIPSLSMLNEIAKKLNVSPADLIGYHKQKIQLNTMADVLYVINELNKMDGLHFDVEVQKPTDENNNSWSCALRFDGMNKNYDMNQSLCLFLESYRDELEEKNDSPQWQAYFDRWFEQQLVYYSKSGIGAFDMKGE